MNNLSRQKFFSIDPPRSRLLSELWHYQRMDRHISRQAIRLLARKHQVSEIEIEGVASFYHFFHLKPAGKHIIYLNTSVISELRGYERIRDAFEEATGARLGGTDVTGTFGIYPTACIGLSDQEPAALIDFHPFTNLNVLKVKEIVNQLRDGMTPAEICDHPLPNIRYLPPNDRTVFFAPYRRGEALKKLEELGRDGILEEVKASGLSGRGGAFFPTWKKWDICRSYEATPKFIICNADEGEPGTFKDRVLLQEQPGSVIEGMILSAYVVGASYGMIYLRGEYQWLLNRLEDELVAFRESGLLGNSIAGIKGFDFDIRIELGAGAYVCGEETALLESMEGRRGEPRTKWFYPVERGYLQYPTVVNNVETFAAAARIIAMTSASYNDRGIKDSPGTKLISVAGDCKLPGIYEIEYGMTVEQLFEHCGAEEPHFIQVSGPSGETISMKEKHRRFSRIDLLAGTDIRCGGSFMVFNRDRDILHILMNFNAFFKHESCGVCTPCRAGNFIIQRKLERLKNGLGDASDLADLKNWSEIMKKSSRCGLGKTAGNAVIQSVEKFGEEFRETYTSYENDLIRPFDYPAATEPFERYKP